MSDLISRLSELRCQYNCFDENERDAYHTLSEAIKALSDVPDTNVGDINKFIDGLEEIFAGLRERHVDDSVCGLCEYDGAYIGQSGYWCNECPGFDRDDCFKLSDKCRKRWIDAITNSLPSSQPEPEELDFVQPHKKIDVRLEIGQPDRSLWFRIGEICVDESKGFISPGRAVEKIRELLRETGRWEE